ncbi:DUF4190 domain-containing protein [Microbacterium sp. NPDC091382]|uniref:DUF4190 domain-containing protein n=1 Tax=Microbacterium sp. NPDC091382 TaxID=3364210 RepID=UPI00380758FC
MTDPNQPNSQNIPPAPPAYEAPAYGNAPQYNAGAPANAPVPGRTMAIVALILAIIPGTQLIGLILGIVALVQSRKAGAKNGLAIAAIIVSVVLMIIAIIVIIALVAAFANSTTDLYQQYQTNCLTPGGSGFVDYLGQRIACEQFDQSQLNN